VEAQAVAGRERLLRRGLWLEYVTLGWNVVGVVILAIAALGARSVALAGFGLDSLIEILASTVVVWCCRLAVDRHGRGARADGDAGDRRGFYRACDLYRGADGVSACDGRPESSPLGIAWTAVTCVAMFSLAYGKARTGTALGNPVLKTEGRVTLVDAYLAGAVLVGLALNAVFGWWWADPLAGLVIVVYGLREGCEALQHHAAAADA
jgi:divalent metal cation (Fe/Co/Zn/Cd) transporter